MMIPLSSLGCFLYTIFPSKLDPVTHWMEELENVLGCTVVNKTVIGKSIFVLPFLTAIGVGSNITACSQCVGAACGPVLKLT